MRHASLALVLACGACAGVGGPHPAPLHIAPATIAPDAPWWQGAGDPLLTQLIEQGEKADAALTCRADALHQREDTAKARKLKTRLTRLIAPRDSAPARQADAYALAAARNSLAARIALAYVEARRWQARIALRAHALEPLRDNAEIARFRREAGLVSALDGDMADLMTGLDTASVEAARAHLSDAIAELSTLTGSSADDLRVLLGPDGAVPGFVSAPAPHDLTHRGDLMALQIRLTADLAHHKVTQKDLDAALADPQSDNAAAAQWHKAIARAEGELHEAEGAQVEADNRLSAIVQSETLANRARGDARLAYRAGTESFATLYVAEGIALAAQERRIDAQAAIAQAAILLWRAQGLGWSPQDLTPNASGTICDRP